MSSTHADPLDFRRVSRVSPADRLEIMSHFATPSSWANLETFSRALSASPRPAVIWYGVDGERIELSGKVLENWIAKSANLFVDELDAVHGDAITLRATPHWRSIAAALGALRAGCTVTTADEAAFWLGFEHDHAADLADVAVYMARGALAMSYDGSAQDFPEGSLDYCAEIRSFGDVFDPIDAVASGHVISAPSEGGTGPGITVRQWLDRAAEWAEELDDVEVQAIQVAAPTGHLTMEFLAWCCGVMATERAVVLLDPSVASDEERAASICRDELATRSITAP